MQNSWHKKLNTIPAIKSAGLISCEPLTQGKSNQVFKITTKAGQWVIRFNHAQAGVHRDQEHTILKLIEPLDIHPNIIENNPQRGFLIQEYLAEPCWQKSDFTLPTQLTTLANQLAKFHTLTYQDDKNRLDNRLQDYLSSFDVVPEQLRIQTEQQIDILEKQQFWQACNTLCHYDLNPSNIIGQRAMIIDWEFAGQGHPLIDWLIMEYESGCDLHEYYPTNINKQWIVPCKSLIQSMMSLWQLIQAE